MEFPSIDLWEITPEPTDCLSKKLLLFNLVSIMEKSQFCVGSSQFYEKIIVEGLLVQPILRAKTDLRY